MIINVICEFKRCRMVSENQQSNYCDCPSLAAELWHRIQDYLPNKIISIPSTLTTTNHEFTDKKGVGNGLETWQAVSLNERFVIQRYDNTQNTDRIIPHEVATRQLPLPNNDNNSINKSSEGNESVRQHESKQILEYQESKMTLILYLADSIESNGGRTLLYGEPNPATPSTELSSKSSSPSVLLLPSDIVSLKGSMPPLIQSVIPKEGTILIFPSNMLHSGERIKSGWKYILKTDIFYRRILPSFIHITSTSTSTSPSTSSSSSSSSISTVSTTVSSSTIDTSDTKSLLSTTTTTTAAASSSAISSVGPRQSAMTTIRVPRPRYEFYQWLASSSELTYLPSWIPIAHIRHALYAIALQMGQLQKWNECRLYIQQCADSVIHDNHYYHQYCLANNKSSPSSTTTTSSLSSPSTSTSTMTPLTTIPASDSSSLSSSSASSPMLIGYHYGRSLSRPERVLYTLCYSRCLTQLLEDMKAANLTLRNAITVVASSRSGSQSIEIMNARAAQLSCRNEIYSLRQHVMTFLTDPIANPSLSSSMSSSTTLSSMVDIAKGTSTLNETKSMVNAQSSAGCWRLLLIASLCACYIGK
jgi:hypothetical protein